MGRRGPNPEPVAAKRARGETRPSRLNLEAPQPRNRPPQMPRGMDAGAQAVWRRVVKEMEGTGVILAADADILRLYCEAMAGYAEHRRLLSASGPLIRGSRGRELVVNPLSRIVREERDAVRLLARELGLSPAARAGLRVDATGPDLDMAESIGLPPRLRVVNE